MTSVRHQGHEYIVTDDKEGENSELDKHLADANILISTPFHPAYLTKERIEKAKNLKLSITAGVGSDHVDLHAAADSGMTVAEVTGIPSPVQPVTLLLLHNSPLERKAPTTAAVAAALLRKRTQYLWSSMDKHIVW